MLKNMMKKYTALSLLALTITASSICSEEAAAEQIGTELIRAATEGNATRVDELLSSFPGLVPYRTSLSTPLHRAVSEGHEQVVTTLLQHGVPVDATTEFGDTALMLVRQTEILEILLQYGANIEHVDRYGDTPLSRATSRGLVDICRTLLQHGANTETTNIHGHTPVHLATETMHLNIAELLLKHGANVDATDNTDSTPLAKHSRKRILSWTNQRTRNSIKEMIKLLIRYGAAITDDIALNIHVTFPDYAPRIEAALSIEKKRRTLLEHKPMPTDVTNLIFSFEECYENQTCCQCSKTIRELLTPDLLRVCSTSALHRICTECDQQRGEHTSQNCPTCGSVPQQ